MTNTIIEHEELVEKVTKAVSESKGDWVLARVYVNREKSTKQALELNLDSLGLYGKSVFDIRVPEETVIEFDKAGRKKTIERVREPGYVLICMETSDLEAVNAVRRTPGVLGWAGTVNEPITMSVAEVVAFLMPAIATAETHSKEKAIQETIHSGAETTRDTKHTGKLVEVPFVVGETVLIASGPFEQTEGKIVEIDVEHEQVQLLVNIFGRETSVELPLSELRKAL